MGIAIKQLRQHAKELQAQAAEASRMADELEKLPDPIGQAITDVATMLKRHRLCVISRDALLHAEVCVEAFDPDGLCEQIENEQALLAVKTALERS